MRTHPLISWSRCLVLPVLLLALVTGQRTAVATEPPERKGSGNPLSLFQVGAWLTGAQKIHPQIFQAPGISRTTLVVTPEGNVVIDTSLAQTAARHRAMLRKVSAAPTRFILLTHTHQDHTGGIEVWREGGTQVVAQQECLEFLRYQGRLAEFFRRRNAAQFAVNLAESQLGPQLEPDVVFDQKHAFQLGGLDFELHHAPGETYDHVAIWIPQLRAAFVGDNYYRSFPNLYTPRGTKPRWALDYVRSLDLVLSWKPEILVSGHSPPIVGERKIHDAVSRYRDAIAYVHDATVRGMNAGKDVATLMREIQLPERLRQNEKYGSVAWSVRGIFEGYAGWFQGNPTELFPQPLSESYRKLLQLCGVAAVVTAAEEELAAEHAVTALQLADIVLSVEPEQRAAWKVRQEALQRLLARSTNAIESGWLLHGVRDARSHLRQLESRPDTVTRWTAQESSRSPTSPAK